MNLSCIVTCMMMYVMVPIDFRMICVYACEFYDHVYMSMIMGLMIKIMCVYDEYSTPSDP